MQFTLHLYRIALVLHVTLISRLPCYFLNHEKENEIIYYSWNLTNKGNKTFLSFFLSFFTIWYQMFNKKPVTTLNSTNYKEFIYVFLSLYQRMKNFLIH